MTGHLFLTGYDWDFECENIPTCPCASEEFIKWRERVKMKIVEEKEHNCYHEITIGFHMNEVDEIRLIRSIVKYSEMKSVMDECKNRIKRFFDD